MWSYGSLDDIFTSMWCFFCHPIEPLVSLNKAIFLGGRYVRSGVGWLAMIRGCFCCHPLDIWKNHLLKWRIPLSFPIISDKHTFHNPVIKTTRSPMSFQEYSYQICCWIWCKKQLGSVRVVYSSICVASHMCARARNVITSPPPPHPTHPNLCLA